MERLGLGNENIVAEATLMKNRNNCLKVETLASGQKMLTLVEQVAVQAMQLSSGFMMVWGVFTAKQKWISA